MFSDCFKATNIPDCFDLFKIYTGTKKGENV